MRICILEEASDHPDDWPTVILPYLQEHDCEIVAVHKATAVTQVIELAGHGFDVFINLCDGAWDSESPGIEVVQALERLGLPFTGATSSFYDPSREQMKRVCYAWEIPTPAYVLAESEDDIARAAGMLRFPMIVKHPNGYSSVGLTRASRVETPEALHEQARGAIKAFGGALIEEFIDGREFTVLVAENPDDACCPIAYNPVEFRFPEGETFKHYDLKWKDYAGMTCVPCDDPALAESLKDFSRRMFIGLGGTGYGRCDFRMDAEGTPYMLEINPNCGVFYAPEDAGSADLILLNDPAGHTGFLKTIIGAALERHRRHQPTWAVRHDRDGHYRMVAVRPLEPGALIESFEEKAHVLVTKTLAMTQWDARRKDWFARYAYPLTDELYVTWSDDAAQWQPINHACDPNAWLDGLNLVARHAIAPGEEITMDYATLYNETMAPFTCTCGAPACRGLIRGTDYLEPFVERYGNHVSDYVRTKRRAVSQTSTS